jgi:ribonuclease HII
VKQKIIVGVDEVGRGAWAGPLVVGAVILGPAKPEGLTDSKLLTRNRRLELAQIIKSQAIAAVTGWVSHGEVDELGLTAATGLAISRALKQIKQPYDEIIIDGSVNFLRDNPKTLCLPRADKTIPAVSAASIIAKVERDEYMQAQAKIHKLYGFEKHVGYGTRFHIEAVSKLGICSIHRRSYKPLARYI